MDRLVDHCFVFEGNGVISDFPGNYSRYREYSDSLEKVEAKEQSDGKTKKKESAAPKEKTKLSFHEKQEFDRLEKDLSENSVLPNLADQSCKKRSDLMKFSW